MYVLCPLLLLSIHSLLKRQKAVQLHEAKAADFREEPSRNSPCAQHKKAENPVKGKKQDQHTSCTTTQLEVPEYSRDTQVRDWRKCALRELSAVRDEQMIKNEIFSVWL